MTLQQAHPVDLALPQQQLLQAVSQILHLPKALSLQELLLRLLLDLKQHQRPQLLLLQLVHLPQVLLALQALLLAILDQLLAVLLQPAAQVPIVAVQLPRIQAQGHLARLLKEHPILPLDLQTQF